MQVSETGWTPHHFVVLDTASKALVGCCPMYLKARTVLPRMQCPSTNLLLLYGSRTAVKEVLC